MAWLLHRGTRALLVVGTACALTVPVYFVFLEAFGDRADGVRRFLDEPNTWQVVRTTVAFAVATVAVALPLGTCLAWCSHRLPTGRRWMAAIPLLPFLLPPLVRVVAFTFLMSPSAGFLNSALRTIPPFRGDTEGPLDVYTPFWIVVISGMEYAPVVVLFMRSSMSQLHQDLLDAGGACGASPGRVLRKVVMPLLRPAILYAATTVTVLAMGQFVVPLLLGRDVGMKVLATEVFYRTQTFPADISLATAYGVPILVASIMLLIFHRFLTRNQDRYVVSGGQGMRPLRGNSRGAQVVLLTYGLLAVVLPVVGLLIVSFQPYWSRDIDVSIFTLQNYRDVLGTDDLTQSISNSVQFALLTAAILLPLAYVSARVIYSRRVSRTFATIQDVIVTAPLGIPAVIFGTGFLVAYTTTPLRLYGSTWGVVLVYVTILMPFAVRFIQTGIMNLGDAPGAAAAASGAGLLRRLRIEVALVRPALASAGVLVFVLATQEFSASILIRSNTTQVMGTIMFDLYTTGSYGRAAVMGGVTCAVTGVGLAVALLLGGRGALNERRSVVH